jgi:primase-polymerase (primpol)-like protein
MSAIILPALVELKEQKHWVCWKYELSEIGKPTKVPYQPNNVKASTKDASTWSTFDAVAAIADAFNGIGFVLTNSDVVAFDLDKCRDPATGNVDDWAETLVARLAATPR